MAVLGSHLWVLDGFGRIGKLAELSATSGSLVRLINLTSESDGLKNVPGAGSGIAASGSHLWVSTGANAVIELNASNGSLVRVIKGKSYDFNGTGFITVIGPHVWVSNWNGNSVTELNASNGSLVRVIG